MRKLISIAVSLFILLIVFSMAARSANAVEVWGDNWNEHADFYIYNMSESTVQIITHSFSHYDFVNCDRGCTIEPFHAIANTRMNVDDNDDNNGTMYIYFEDTGDQVGVWATHHDGWNAFTLTYVQGNWNMNYGTETSKGAICLPVPSGDSGGDTLEQMCTTGEDPNRCVSLFAVNMNEDQYTKIVILITTNHTMLQNAIDNQNPWVN